MHTQMIFLAAISVVHSFSQPSTPLSLAARLKASAHPLSKTPKKHLRHLEGSPGVRISPLEYGADPLGVKDSSDALTQCIQACWNYSVILDPLGHFPGDDSFKNGEYIRNAGGCEIDLGGGEYLLSKPVIIPEYLGNLRIGHGSLVADEENFPTDSFLLVVGVKGSCNVPQGSCNVDLGFPELFFDGRHVASALQINNVMGTTVGPGSYFLNFTQYGMQVNGGHEVMMNECWLGETNFDYPFTQNNPPTSVAIQINVRCSPPP